MTGEPRTEPLRAAVLTISSSRAAGEAGADESGDALGALVARLGGELVGRDLVGDDRDAIEARLRDWAEEPACDLVLTTGGTGLGPDDVTPEATTAVIERPVPGIGEAIRAASAPHTDRWMLSRAVAGICGSTLIVNFPGSPKSIAETGEALVAALPHAVSVLRGEPHG